MKTVSPVPPARILLIVIGFIVWSSGFVALYAVNAIGCAFGWPAPLQRGILLVLFALHAAALAGFCHWSWTRWRRLERGAEKPARTLEYLGLGTGLAALAATLFVLAPALVISMCI